VFLGELIYPVSNIAGIGPGAAKSLAALGVLNIADLIKHYPIRYEDRKNPVPLANSSLKKPAVTIATVQKQDYAFWKNDRVLKVTVSDDTDIASLLCYGRNFLASKLKPGKRIWLTGPFNRNRYGDLQSGTFAFEDYVENRSSKEFERILPIYPLSGKLNQALLRSAIRSALDGYGKGIRDELPDSIRTEMQFPHKEQCLRDIHFPENSLRHETARRALIFEELFLLQVSVARMALLAKQSGRGRPHAWSGRLVDILKSRLDFELTPDQITSIEDIRKDISSEHRMNRLLQGEVGSGKTLVAFIAALGIINAGGQVAFMAPTELLARQHADNAAKLLEPLGVRVAFISSDVSDASRTSIRSALATGDIDLCIGTHALFSSDVIFLKLGLAIIDEQHRFGVDQRRLLSEKGNSVNLLVLSATPIPRTLAMTAFGDMDISSIQSMPRGRIPVETHLARMGNEGRVYDFVRRELDAGSRAYFIYPLIEESKKNSLKDAQNMFLRLSKEVFPEHRAALIHSRIDEEEKRRIMSDFRSGACKLLVATSVVEVGVDVSEATCIVIEHAERFGLSALHQLRGRVGRGNRKSYCFLVYSEPLTDEGKRRLIIMKDTRDGFALAEEDLKMRGPGDMVGIKQSGFLKMSISDPVRDLQVLLQARAKVKEIVTSESSLLEKGLENLHRLFETCPPFDENLISTG